MSSSGLFRAAGKPKETFTVALVRGLGSMDCRALGSWGRDHFAAIRAPGVDHNLPLHVVIEIAGYIGFETATNSDIQARYQRIHKDCRKLIGVWA